MTTTVALSWDTLEERKRWSTELLAAVTAHKAALGAGDPRAFLPEYPQLSADRQEVFWAELIIAVAKYESDWRPHAVYHEPPPLSVDSVGLLQLSYEDERRYGLEPLSRERRDLEDPLVNLRCGVRIMAALLAKDHVVAHGSRGDARGASRYWSVLWDGHHRHDISARVRAQLGLAA